MAITGLANAAKQQPLTPELMLSLARPSTAAVSPNGQHAVFSTSRYSFETHKTIRNLNLLNLKDNTVSDFTPREPGTSHSDAFWLDDDHVAFLSQEQVYVKSVTGNGEPYALTTFPVGIANVKYNQKAGLLVFSAPVYADGTLQGAKERDDELKTTKQDTGLAYDHLMVRHWDEFVQEKKNNIFVVKIKSDDKAAFAVDGEPINLLKDTGLESPIIPFGDADDFDLSPDGTELVFAAKINTPDNAWQTTTFIYTIGTDGKGQPKKINPESVGYAGNPSYSSTGKSIAYLQMRRPQYESDRRQIVLFSEGKSQLVAENWDRSPGSLLFDKKDESIVVTAEENGHVKVFKIDIASGNVETIVDEHTQSGVQYLDDNTLLYSTASMMRPNDVYTVDLSTKKIQQRTDIHAEDLESVFLSTPEDVWFKGDKDHDVHGWLLKPIGFDPAKKYPLAFIVHGGPQGAFNDAWSTRWNQNVFASAGFVVVALNPTGSTGYGQAFTDAINQNWGGSPFIDLMKGLDFVLQNHTYIDPQRTCALGASYGGYMMNWFNGHTDRFNCLVNHDGIFDLKVSYYTTEELYFPEHDQGGVPWDPKNKAYDQWNPSNFVDQWKTPTLVIHSDKDYRLPVTEGLSTFTVLQRRGIPSRFLYFPDENHWVLKAANSQRWHHEVLSWIQKWTKETTTEANKNVNLSVNELTSKTEQFSLA
ncbi:hypothetical protein DFQ26_003101 [Actinomortierella ambigua]|nr:hypothetical protein DFQ26_003101 [Actinomortierella ambigua]